MIVCPGMWHKSDDYDFADMMAAFERSIDRAEKDFGVYARCKATLERGDSEEAVEKNWWAAKQIVENSDHPYLVGLDLANYEQLGDIPGHKDLFDHIEANQKKPLDISMHAGENAGPQNIQDALDAGAKRGGHITCIMDDPELVKKVVAAKFHGEICLTSNEFSKAVPSLDAHRITDIYNAGVRISLNTDDPTFFRTTIGREYEIAKDQFGFTDLQLIDITLMAIEDSFAEESLKAKCKERVFGMIENAYNCTRDEISQKRGSANVQDQPLLKSA